MNWTRWRLAQTVIICPSPNSWSNPERLSGTCDLHSRTYRGAAGVATGSFIVPGDTEHVDFTEEEFAQFTTEALMLYKSEIIDVE